MTQQRGGEHTNTGRQAGKRGARMRWIRDFVAWLNEPEPAELRTAEALEAIAAELRALREALAPRAPGRAHGEPLAHPAVEES